MEIQDKIINQYDLLYIPQQSQSISIFQYPLRSRQNSFLQNFPLQSATIKPIQRSISLTHKPSSLLNNFSSNESEFSYASKVLQNATNYCLIIKGDEGIMLMPVREFQTFAKKFDQQDKQKIQKKQTGEKQKGNDKDNMELEKLLQERNFEKYLEQNMSQWKTQKDLMESEQSQKLQINQVSDYKQTKIMQQFVSKPQKVLNVETVSQKEYFQKLFSQSTQHDES